MLGLEWILEMVNFKAQVQEVVLSKDIQMVDRRIKFNS